MLEIDVMVLVTITVLEGIVVTMVAGTVDVEMLTELTVAVETGRKQSQPFDTALYARDSSCFGASGYLRPSDSGLSFAAVVAADLRDVGVALMT